MLSPKEKFVLQSLAQGKRYSQIKEVLCINLSNLHTICGHIRKKTGIVSTKNANECRAFIRQAALPKDPKKQQMPSDGQLEILRMIADGKSYLGISQALKITIQTAQNHAFLGCQRAKIIGKGHNRSAAIRAYLKSLSAPASLMDDPMF